MNISGKIYRKTFKRVVAGGNFGLEHSRDQKFLCTIGTKLWCGLIFESTGLDLWWILVQCWMDRIGIHMIWISWTTMLEITGKCPRIPDIENLIREYYKDEEEPVLWFLLWNLYSKLFHWKNFSHNDVHGGNLMMDKNGTADSAILVDFDLASYGFAALDLACIMFYSSSGCKRLSTDLRLYLLPPLKSKILARLPWYELYFWWYHQFFSGNVFDSIWT